uniref:SRCR domain-containing protein n=1 Tax=Davidia involucrata TaxID=16924 RepID=A0A5B6ZT63_DAVIN
MMDSWRRQKGDNYNQEVTRTRSQNRKPPLGNWQPTVPSWEKKFCTLVGSVPWRKLVETKKIMHLYDNVVKWNDSAGEEAFHNAKNRYWAAINGLRCDISLPDPNIYIDEIDWNSSIDPELLLDLERDFVVPDGGENDEKVVILGQSLLLDQSFSCTGWGEAEEGVKKVCNSSSDNNENPWERNGSHGDGAVRESGWGDVCNNPWSEDQGNGAMKESGWGHGAVRENGWGDVCNNSWSENQGNGAMKGSGCGDGWNNSWGWNQWENNNYESKNLKNRSTDGGGGTWDANNGKREGTRRYMSRYKTSRFHGDDHQMDREWRNGKGRKRGNFVYEQPFTDKRPSSRQWNLMDSCGPVSHHGSGKAGNPWSWEKPVS